MKKPHISIVVLTYNSTHRVEALFDSFKYLPLDKFNFDFIVVDNDSQDVERLKGLVQQYQKKLTILFYVICLSENYFWSFANNIGVEYALGKHVMLVNPDCVFKQGSFENLFELTKKYDIVCPKMVNSDGSISHAGGGVDRKNEPIYFNIGEGELDEGQYDIARSTHWCTGACILFKKAIHKELNGFKEHGEFYHYNSDRDFCLRAAEKGYTCGIGGKETEIIHLIGKSCKGARK